MGKQQSEETKMAVLALDVGYIRKSVDSMGETLNTLDKKYVSRAEFLPVKAIVYGGAAMILIGVFATLIFMATGIKINIR